MVFQAGFVTFFRTVALVLLFYYGFKIVANYLFPILLKIALRKIHKKAQNPYEQPPHAKNKEHKVGETIIDKKPTERTGNNTVGEYVDYEEVD